MYNYFYRGDSNLPIEEVIFENYKNCVVYTIIFIRGVKIEFPYWRGNFLNNKIYNI